jgi:hypothetical protein
MFRLHLATVGPVKDMNLILLTPPQLRLAKATTARAKVSVPTLDQTMCVTPNHKP